MPGGVWNCLWGHALQKYPGINRKSRVSYPGPGFLSSSKATLPSLPKKQYNGFILTKPNLNVWKTLYDYVWDNDRGTRHSWNAHMLLMTVVVSTSEYLNRYGSGFTLIFMVWTVKNDVDVDPFNLDRKTVIGVFSLRVPWKVIRIKVIWIGNGLDIQVWTRLVWAPIV